MTSVALCMIVRDEERVIERCLESVYDAIDAWCVVDTGSTDGTKRLVREVLGDKPGRLVERPWGRPPTGLLNKILGRREVDFSHNRNEALDLALPLGCDYALVIDADDCIVEGDVRAAMEKNPGYGAYAAKMQRPHGEGPTWFRKMVLRPRGWRYEGRIDEEAMPLGLGKVDVMPGVLVSCHEDGARAAGDQAAKYRRDAAILAEEHRRRPRDAHLLFNLGLKLSAAEDFEGALRALKRRAGIPGDNEERFYALFQVGNLLAMTGADVSDVKRAWELAHDARPTRAEPLLSIAKLHADRGEFALAELYARAAARLNRPQGDLLLVDESVYRWRAGEFLAGALTELGKLDEARELLIKMANAGRFPESEHERVSKNIGLIAEAQAAA